MIVCGHPVWKRKREFACTGYFYYYMVKVNNDEYALATVTRNHNNKKWKFAKI